MTMRRTEFSTGQPGRSRASKDAHVDTVESAISDLATLGAIEVDGSLETREGAWFSQRYVYGFDWADRPTIKIRDDLQAGPMQYKRLGDAEA